MTKRSIRVPDDASCIDCGYSFFDLTSDICPECGRAFDADDKSSFFTKTRRRSWRTWARPPSLLTILLVLVSSSTAIVASSDPGSGITLAVVVVLVLPIYVFAAIVDYVVRAIACQRDSKRAALDVGATRLRRSWRWWVLPVCLLVLVTLRTSDWPFRVRFAMSRSAFDVAQRKIDAGSPAPAARVWVGLYPVTIESWEDSTIFVASSGYSKTAYVRGRPQTDKAYWCRSIDGDWYLISIDPYSD